MPSVATNELPSEREIVSSAGELSANVSPDGYGDPLFAAPAVYPDPSMNVPFSPVPS